MFPKIGLIGGGGEAWEHLSACVHSQRVRTVSLAESDEATVARLRGRFGIIKHVTADYRELLADPEITVVDLCLSPGEQEGVAAEALAAGKHVLCSVPLAASTAGAEALIAAAEASDGRLLCLLYQRFLPAHVRARALLAEKTVGEPLFGSITVELPVRTAGETLAVERCHALDTLQSFLGPACTVSAMRRMDGEGDSVMAESLSLGFESGALGQVALLRTGTERVLTERRLVGAEGTILIRDNPEDELPLVVVQGEGFFPVRVKCPPDVREFAIMAATEHFLQCLEENKAESVTAAAAVSALKVSLAAEVAVAEGRNVVV